MRIPAETRRRVRAACARAGRLALAAVLAALAALPALPSPALGSAAPAGALTLHLASAPTVPGSGIIDYPSHFTSATPARLRHAGVGIAIRYVGANKWKSLTRAEANALRAGGIDIIAVYETKAKWMLGGRKAGVSAAKAARSAIAKCGGPSNAFVYFACDTGTHDYGTVNACLKGAASVIGANRVGIYGSYSVCANALASGCATKAWQTTGWSGGKFLPQAALYQTAGHAYGNLALDYDSNFPRTEDVGQWGYSGPGAVSWDAVTPSSAATLTSVSFGDAADGWAVGDDGAVLHTADGGSAWTTQSVPGTVSLAAVGFADDSAGWAAGDGGTLLRTANGGVGWATQSTPTSAALSALEPGDGGSAWAVGSSGAILHTTNGGATWLAQSSGTTAALDAVDFVGSTGIAVGAGGTVLRTTNGGSTWTPQAAPTSAELTSVHLASSKLGWAVGAGGTVLRTTDGGSAWTRQSTPGTATLNSVDFIDGVTGWAVGAGGTVLRTANGGATWLAQSSPTTATLTSVDITGPKTAWVVGAAGTILRATIDPGPFGTVSGTVTDASSGHALNDISVSILPSDGGASQLAAPTATDGTFVAARVKPGTYNLSFSNSLYITNVLDGVGVSAGLRTSGIKDQLTPKTVTSLARPSVEPTQPLSAQPTTLTVKISPSVASTAAATTIYGSHFEWKKVKKKVKIKVKVKGRWKTRTKTKKVKVWYWRARFAARMTADSSGRLFLPVALAAGRWRAHAKFPGNWKYLPSTSATVNFAVL